jgi:hypothetical protein
VGRLQEEVNLRRFVIFIQNEFINIV